MFDNQTIENITFGIKRVVGGGNHDVNETRLNSIQHPDYQVIPYSVYMIYIAFNANGQPNVLHYLHVAAAEIPPLQVPFVLTAMATRARSDISPGPMPQKVPSGDPGLQPFGLHRIEWKRISYVAVIVDSQYWKLHKFKPYLGAPEQSAVVFNTEKESTPNHSFFDAAEVTIPLPSTGPGDLGTRSAIYFVNHMKKSEFGDELGVKNPDGTTLKIQREPFVFDIYFEVTAVDGSASVFIVDPDGSNEGPPIGPP